MNDMTNSVPIDDDLEMGVFGARLSTAMISVFLVVFYSVQMHWKRCNFHPLFVQSVTAMVYALAAFDTSGFLVVESQKDDGIYEKIELGRYLFWIMTCPVIIANMVALLTRLNPAGQPLQLTVSLMSKDVMMTSFGIIAAFQPGGTIKTIFIVLSFFLYGWLGLDFYKLGQANHIFYPAEMWKWVKSVCIFAATSWSIFPILYVLGNPVLAFLPAEADAIAHALADLFAKNVCGFLVWYVRFYLIEPLYEARAQKKLAFSPPGTVAPATLMSKNNRRRGKNDFSEETLNVLIIEDRIELQRLFSIILEDVNIVAHFCFNTDEADMVVRREYSRYFHALLLSIPQHLDKLEEVGALRNFVSSHPYFIPVIGYSFDDSIADKLDKDDYARVCDGFIQHALDQMHIRDQVLFWQETRKKRVEAHKAEQAQRELFLGTTNCGTWKPNTPNDSCASFISLTKRMSSHIMLDRDDTASFVSLGAFQASEMISSPKHENSSDNSRRFDGAVSPRDDVWIGTQEEPNYGQYNAGAQRMQHLRESFTNENFQDDESHVDNSTTQRIRRSSSNTSLQDHSRRSQSSTRSSPTRSQGQASYDNKNLQPPSGSVRRNKPRGNEITKNRMNPANRETINKV